MGLSLYPLNSNFFKETAYNILIGLLRDTVILTIGKPLFTPFAWGKLLTLLVICGDKLYLPCNNLSFLVTRKTVTQHVVICLFFGLQYWLTLVFSLKTGANTSFVLFSAVSRTVACADLQIAIS